MTDNVIELRRRPRRRPRRPELGFYVRVAYNDHAELLDLIATGERGVFGFVVDAPNLERHSDLITEARNRDFDIILDPKTQEMGTPGRFSERLANLPWGGEQFHRVQDFEGDFGRAHVERIVSFALEHGFTQLIGPSHLLQSPNDPWLRRDVSMMTWTRDLIDASDADILLIYSLALPISVLRDRAQREALMVAVSDIPCDAIWLKIENFGDDATGEKAAAYVEACRDFHGLGLPIVSDMVGGLAGLGAVALGASGGIAHGVTMHQSFKASSWRRPPDPNGRARLPERRVYVPELDMLLKPSVARDLIQSSTRARGLFGCADSHCCPHGVHDMLNRPARHALYQRARELEQLAATPQSVRAQSFLDTKVRPVSDHVARAAGFSSLDEALRKKLSKKQTQVSGFRHAMTHLVEEDPSPSYALAPLRRASRP